MGGATQEFPFYFGVTCEQGADCNGTKIRVILVPQDQLMYETGDARESLPIVSFPGQMIRYRSLCEMRRKVLEEDEKLYRGEIHIREVWEVVLTVETNAGDDAGDGGGSPVISPMEENEKSSENDLGAILENETVSEQKSDKSQPRYGEQKSDKLQPLSGEQKSDKLQPRYGEQKSDKSQALYGKVKSDKFREFEFHVVPSPDGSPGKKTPDGSPGKKTSKPKHVSSSVGFLSLYDDLSIPTMNKGRGTNVNLPDAGGSKRSFVPWANRAVTPGLNSRCVPRAMLSVPEVDDSVGGLGRRASDEKTSTLPGQISHWESGRRTEASYAAISGQHSFRRASMDSVMSMLPRSMRSRPGLRRDENSMSPNFKNDGTESNSLREGLLKMENRVDKMSAAFEEAQSQTNAMLANLTEVLTEMKKTSSRTIVSDNRTEVSDNKAI